MEIITRHVPQVLFILIFSKKIFILIFIFFKIFVNQVLLRGEHVVMVSPEQQADNDQVGDAENDE